MPALDRPYSAYSKSADKSALTLPPETKPINIFYVWYMELCRRQNTNPINTIRSANHRNNQILDFTADRIKIDDWQPIINALRLDLSLHVVSVHSRLSTQKFLEEADTEDKVKRIKKWFGAICTKYVLRNLLKAIGSMVRRTQMLTCLELDGLQIIEEYLEIILKALTFNKSLKYLSFKSCPVGDHGCFEICDTMHSLPNVEVLNLSSCGLGIKSAEHISKLIKYQQINRYCESWHSSLRYEDPIVNNMAGLKRITINNNPNIGDEGLLFILNELDDDLWIKALDMQRCNVTENISGKLLDVVDYSRSLEVADFRHNHLTAATIDQILQMLKSKQGLNGETEYQWCLTSTSIGSSAYGTYASLFNTKATPKLIKSYTKPPLKRQVTILENSTPQKDEKEKINNLVKPDNTLLVKAKEQLLQLYERLKEETNKRQEAEKKCEELQKQVDELLNQQTHQIILREFSNMKDYIMQFIQFVKENGNLQEHGPIIRDLQHALDEVHNLAKPYETSCKFNPPAVSEKTLRETLDINEDDKLLSMFQSFLGKSEADSNDLVSDLSINLDSSSSESQNDTYQKGSESSARSTDSESVETYKRLLEELSQETDSKNSSSEEDLFMRHQMNPKKMVIKLPPVSI